MTSSCWADGSSVSGAAARFLRRSLRIRPLTLRGRRAAGSEKQHTEQQCEERGNLHPILFHDEFLHSIFIRSTRPGACSLLILIP